jgi:4-amino-4-deoxy-L-arabinose transferase-like glycosyltransferase
VRLAQAGYSGKGMVHRAFNHRGIENEKPCLAWEALALFLIVLLAAVLRFCCLETLPPGLHFDEGFKGVTARALLEGATPQLFFAEDMGEEPIAIYLVALTLSLFGQEPWAIRLLSAIVGMLTVPLTWFLGRELFRSRIAGLGAALVLAILYWHVSFSRIGMEPILVPFFATLVFAALSWGLNSDRLLAFALAGLALGGSLYTYKAGYFVPILAILYIACAVVMERGFLRRYWRGLALVALVTLLVAAPIVIYFVTHLANFLQRPMSVASERQALADNLLRVLGMFFVKGDVNPRSNLAGRPVLDPFLALLFLVGLGRALIESFRGYIRSFLPLLWLAVMILPTIITEYAPHFGRAIGATPAVALLCALGIEVWIYGIGDWRFLRSNVQHSRLWLALLLVVGLAFSTISTARAYFSTWGHSPDLFYAYDVGLVEIAEQINALPADEDVYLTPTSSDHYTLQFMVHRPFASFDGRAGLLYPPPGRAATVVIVLQEDPVTLPTLQCSRPDGEVIWTLADGYGRPYAAAYRLPAAEAPAPTPDHPADALWGDAIQLVGYSVDTREVTAGETLNVTLYWRALAPLDDDYTVFVHLLGEHNPATNGPLWAGHDGQPDGGHYPTSRWQPGQVLLDLHPLAVPLDTPVGEYQIEVGLYLLATMARLPASDTVENPLPNDAALLDTIEVTSRGR